MTLPASMTQYIGDRIHIVPVEDGEERPFEVTGQPSSTSVPPKAKQFGFTLALHSKKLSCLGDEPCTPRGRKYAAGSGWLSAKLFCLYADRDRFKALREAPQHGP